MWRSGWQFRYRDGVWPNTLALSYAVAGYAAGMALITRDSVWLNAAGSVWLGHAMVIAAYLIHECAHNTIFSRNEDNARLGRLLNWLTGACYGRYDVIRRKHFRHHVDRADVVAFDFRERIRRHPLAVRLVHALEWLYVPAQDIYMHALVLVVPFTLPSRRQDRASVLAVLLVRGTAFGVLAYHFPRVLVFYPLAWMFMATVLRFMDAFQHTYDLLPTLEQPRGDEVKRYDAAFEHRNTYSNVHSLRHPWLNLFTLNFGYHNAHHEKPAAAWHQLPALHRELYGDDETQVLPFSNQLLAFHRYRTQRLLNTDGGDTDILHDKGRSFVGVDGVSFLTGH
ncbi:MAG: fatty acid desaturase [Moraxellaceae bacterium]|nr:fatty acid desaturase [Moraxellaceae bacterium]